MFFARPAPKKPSTLLFLIIGSGKRRQDILPGLLFAIFRTSGLLSLSQSEIRAGKWLVNPGHHQEDLAGGRPHCRYRRTCLCYPGVDRVQQKTHILLMTMPTACAHFLSNPHRIHSVQKDMEKEEYGLLYAVICCAQPLPLTPPPPTLHTISPSRGQGYQD